MSSQAKKNKYFFGLGTVGRDMFYAFEANALLYFLSNILHLPLSVFAAVSMVLSVMRIFDALNDLVTGMFVDNIRSPWGKFKPAILVGGVVSVAFYLILFSEIGSGTTYVIIFAIAYFIWDVSYGINDIGYWTLMPALTTDQKERESIGAFARICANIGMYIIMVGWQPITSAMGNTKQSWFLVAVAMSAMYLLFLCFPLFGVKEKRLSKDDGEETTLKDMWNALVKNDQLMWTALAMALFMVGYCITTGFATYYMQYVFGDINMYPVLAGVCGIAQLAALMVFPLFSKKYNRKQLYTFSTVLIVAGYALFSLADSSLVMIGVAAVLIFVAEAFIQLLMLMFLADTIEYGQWKMGRRHESVTFSIQPLINKIGGALSTAVISLSVILAGIKSADSDVAAESITASGVTTIKIAMLLIPVICILLGFWIYLKKYRIDEKLYGQIISDLKERGEISED